jgi:hypothetical protein
MPLLSPEIERGQEGDGTLERRLRVTRRTDSGGPLRAVKLTSYVRVRPREVLAT